MIRQNLGREDCFEALHVLDEKLDTMGYRGTVEIKAVGGFALIWHGLRESGTTADIDTITPTYDKAVQDAIGEVAHELNIEPDWLNNDAVFTMDDCVSRDDVEWFDGMIGARYEDSGVTFDHINLSIADVNTLARTKAYAVTDIGIGRTSKDFSDFVRILGSQGITSMREAEKAHPWLRDDDLTACAKRLNAYYRSEGKQQVQDAATREMAKARMQFKNPLMVTPAVRTELDKARDTRLG